MIGEFSFTIFGPVYFEVNWMFKATELTNINLVRENSDSFSNVNIIHIKYLD